MLDGDVGCSLDHVEWRSGNGVDNASSGTVLGAAGTVVDTDRRKRDVWHV